MTNEEEAALLRMAQEQVKAPEVAQDPVLFIRNEGWRPGRSRGPPVHSLFHFYRQHGGTGSGSEFVRSLSALGFHRRQSANGKCAMMHHEDAEVLNRWSKANPTPDRVRRSLNTAAKPSVKRLPPIT